MNRYRNTILVCIAIAFVALLVHSAVVVAAVLVKAKDGSGIIGYKDTPVLPWCGYQVHDPDRPAPKEVTPGQESIQEQVGTAPSDATALFAGKGLGLWEESDWKVENGELIAVSGRLTTKDAFGDCQLHLEWMAPDPPVGKMWDRGNNGVLLMGLFEIQIYDSYKTTLYPDGWAAAIYGQTPPKVNSSRKPGQWQSYDIIFFAPVFQAGKLVKPAYVTILHNGVLVHHNEEIRGPTGHRIQPNYSKPIPGKAPLSLSAHNNPVRFRNIWIRAI